MTMIQMLFGFEGRIRRRDWWIWSIACGLAYAAVTGTVYYLVYGAAWTTMNPAFGDPIGPLALAVALYAPWLWIQLALGAKRIHDRNEGAAFIIALQLLTACATYMPDRPLGGDFSDPMVALSLGAQVVILVINLALLVILGCLDGTQGPNRCGRSPKGIGGDPTDRTAEVFG